MVLTGSSIVLMNFALAFHKGQKHFFPMDSHYFNYLVYHGFNSAFALPLPYAFKGRVGIHGYIPCLPCFCPAFALLLKAGLVSMVTYHAYHGFTMLLACFCPAFKSRVGIHGYIPCLPCFCPVFALL